MQFLKLNILEKTSTSESSTNSPTDSVILNQALFSFSPNYSETKNLAGLLSSIGTASKRTKVPQ